MTSRSINPIKNENLAPEIRTSLDRYLARMTKVTGWQWKIKLIYKPGTWHRACLTSQRAGELFVWYRANPGCWTIANRQTGRGITRTRRTRLKGISEKKKQQSIVER